MDESLVAQDLANSRLDCNRSAISAEGRLRHQQLRARICAARLSSSAIAQGYSVRLSEARLTLQELSEWIGLERQCCPWLVLQVERITPHTLELRMTGPDRAKPILSAEFEDFLETNHLGK